MAAEMQCDTLDRTKADKEVAASRAEMERLNKEVLAALARAQNLLVTRLGVTEEKIDGMADGLRSKAGRAEVVTKESLDLSLGDFARKAVVEDRLAFLEEAKAPTSALGPLENRILLRIDRVENAAAGSLKETLKALELKLLAHLSEKAGKEETSGLRAALRKHLTVAHAPGRGGASLPTAAIRKMDHCLTCAQPVAHAYDEIMAERTAEASAHPPPKTGGLPAPEPFHNTFGGLAAADPVGSAYNANLARKRAERARLVSGGPGPGSRLQSAHAQQGQQAQGQQAQGQGGGPGGHRPATAPEPGGGGHGQLQARSDAWGFAGVVGQGPSGYGGPPHDARPQTVGGGGARPGSSAGYRQ